MMKHKLRWTLAAYDALLYVISCIFILIIYPSNIDNLTSGLVVAHIVIGFFCVFISRIIFKIYEQIWRYAGPKEYINILVSDAIACVVFIIARTFLRHRITFVRAVALIMMDLLLCIAIRLIYQLIYHTVGPDPNVVNLLST